MTLYNSSDWRTIGDHRKFFRSKWEANFGRYLQLLKEQHFIEDWEHEPKTFWFEQIKRGVVSYKPDFFVKGCLSRKDHWVEVKGYMDSKSATKIKRFFKYYPAETLRVVDKKWFKENNEKMRMLIKEWE